MKTIKTKNKQTNNQNEENESLCDVNKRSQQATR